MMKREYIGYEANGPDKNKIPQCRCKKKATQRVSHTALNPDRPFFNCHKPPFGLDKQCGFFIWVDEHYRDDESSDQSGDEDEPACCKCLKLKQKIDEIESARASWYREKLELLAELEAVKSKLRVKKKAELARETDVEKLANSRLGQIIVKTELASENDDMPESV